MATVSGIKDVANRARDSKSAIAQKDSMFDRGVSSVSSSWKGDIGEAFKDSAKRIQLQLNTHISDYNDLSSKLNRLANSVKRAEAEEARKQAGKK